MPSGGHARSGPAADPNALHRNGNAASNGWLTMTEPTEPAPAWPFGEPSDREAALWSSLWTRPQASLWPRFHLTTDVAIYVRTLLAFEASNFRVAALGTLLQRQADNLGLSVGGAQHNRWLFPTPVSTSPASVTPIRGNRASSRERFNDRYRGVIEVRPPASEETS